MLNVKKLRRRRRHCGVNRALCQISGIFVPEQTVTARNKNGRLLHLGICLFWFVGGSNAALAGAGS